MDQGSSGSSDRERQDNEIITRYLEAVDAGQGPDRQEWLQQHPEYTAKLGAFLAEYAWMDSTAEPSPPSVEPGTPPPADSVVAGEPATMGFAQPERRPTPAWPDSQPEKARQWPKWKQIVAVVTAMVLACVVVSGYLAFCERQQADELQAARRAEMQAKRDRDLAERRATENLRQAREAEGKTQGARRDEKQAQDAAIAAENRANENLRQAREAEGKATAAPASDSSIATHGLGGLDRIAPVTFPESWRTEKDFAKVSCAGEIAFPNGSRILLRNGEKVLGIDEGVMDCTLKISAEGTPDCTIRSCSVRPLNESDIEILGRKVSPYELKLDPDKTAHRIREQTGRLSPVLKTGKPFAVKSIDAAMRWAPAGEFTMGGDKEKHRVRLSQGFWIGQYVVTQVQWLRLFQTNPSRFRGSLSVEGIEAGSSLRSWRQLVEDRPADLARRLRVRGGRLSRLWHRTSEEAE